MIKVYAIDGVVPVVHPTAFVHPRAVLIGDVIVGPGCYVGPGASLRGDMGRIVVGEGSNLQDNVIVHGFPGTDTVIEAWGHVGHGAVVHGCTVRHNAMIGMNAVVMDGAEVGESAFVAAMAFVKAGFVVPPRTLAAGIPARVLRELTVEEIEWKRTGTREYQNLALRSRETLRETEPLSEVEADRPRVKANPHEPLFKARQKDG
jgi:phenylacetic acid degradation protein